MDALCDLTSKVHKTPAYIDIPAPDYDGAPGTGYYHNNHHTPPQSHHQPGDQEYLSKQSIRKNMSQEIKEINKDISMRPKQDIIKRPEFLSKQHQMKTNQLRKQEEKDREENNELFAKLKSRSQMIDQEEKQKEEEKNLPEFMKIKLKGKETSAVSS